MAKDDEDQLAALLLKWEEAWDLGDDIAAADLCIDHPEIEQRLADQIKLLKSMNWMTKDAADDLSNTDEVDLLLGKTLAGRYQIESVVGFGGHGKVYKAFDPELDRFVAVKVSKSIADETKTNELLEEARRTAKLKHPNIVTVYDVGRHDGQLFFVTELVDGKNLADHIADSLPNITEAKRIVLSVAEALQFAHSQGLFSARVYSPRYQTSQYPAGQKWSSAGDGLWYRNDHRPNRKSSWWNTRHFALHGTRADRW